jgi:CheY-like chemotaxis protein
MVKQLAELHGGSVAVASAEGEGSSFVVWLPLRTCAEPAVMARRSARASVHVERRLALVVDADDQSADLIRLLLEAEGFTVQRAASTPAALEAAPRQTIHLIAVALELAETDGWEFLRHLRNLTNLATVPVVIVAGKEQSNLALLGGAAAVLQKPVSRAELKASLDGLGLHPTSERVYTILVVDDDPKAVEVIATFLPAPAYAVVRAYGGAEAINLAERIRPNLILLDLMMPEVSGFEVADALQRNPDTARIPILVVTAKQITPSDRAQLNATPGKIIHIVEKAGFNRAHFVSEVRRALQTL